MHPDLAAVRGLMENGGGVALTGAGVSTPSGVPDFRSPGGLWSRYRPVEFQEFLASEDARRRYWRYKRETYASFSGARPNAVHEAVARWEARGLLSGVITQNIDGLHQDAGSRNVVELHGSNRRVACLSCAASWTAEAVQARLDAGEEVPRCEECGGLLKPATISFGQSLDAAVLASAFELARRSRFMLVLGTSLVVYPAAALPEAAAAAGSAVLILNREPTPLDALARIVVHGPLEELVPALVRETS
jgi:NAD-dependent deacetylase